MKKLCTTANRIHRVLRQFPGARGARKLTVFRGLAKNQADFERAVGQLFIWGIAKFYGRARGRRLGSA